MDTTLANSLLSQQIIDAVLEVPALEDVCDIVRMQRTGEPDQFLGIAKLRSDPEISAVFTLPTVTTNLYITISDANQRVIGGILGAIENVERTTPIGGGSVILLENAEMKAAGFCGVMLLPASVSNLLCNMEETLVVNGLRHWFFLVIFLTNKEYAVWEQQGHDSLMKYLDRTEKNLIAFGPAGGRAAQGRRAWERRRR